MYANLKFIPISYSDVLAIQALPTGLMHQQLYISPTVARNAAVPQQQGAFKSAVKRPRSPSPQPAVSVSSYHQGYAYKPTAVGTGSYQNSPQSKNQFFILVVCFLLGKVKCIFICRG